MLDRVFNLEVVFVLSGVLLAVFSIFTARDRGNPSRWGSSAFWAILGALFALGSVLPGWVSGLLVVGLVAVDALGLVRHGSYGEASHEFKARSAARLGALLFVPVLSIPVLTYAGAALFSAGRDANAVLFVSLGLSGVVAALFALAITRARPILLIHEGRRLADAIGAAVILPQLLASLGALFRAAKVGDVMAAGVKSIIPADNLFVVVLVCCASIAAFTFVMGNSFAAFPVIMSGIGVPLLVEPFEANAAVAGAILITAASCGTLCTPMAANFNIVPPALFEMRDRYGVIKFQVPVAAAMFVVHVALLWIAVRFVR